MQSDIQDSTSVTSFGCNNLRTSPTRVLYARTDLENGVGCVGDDCALHHCTGNVSTITDQLAARMTTREPGARGGASDGARDGSNLSSSFSSSFEFSSSISQLFPLDDTSFYLSSRSHCSLSGKEILDHRMTSPKTFCSHEETALFVGVRKYMHSHQTWLNIVQDPVLCSHFHHRTTSQLKGKWRNLVAKHPELSYLKKTRKSIRSYSKFEKKEEEALMEGVRRYCHEPNLWACILQDSKLGQVFRNRTNVQLKDKYRSLRGKERGLPVPVGVEEHGEYLDGMFHNQGHGLLEEEKECNRTDLPYDEVRSHASINYTVDHIEGEEIHPCSDSNGNETEGFMSDEFPCTTELSTPSIFSSIPSSIRSHTSSSSEKNPDRISLSSCETPLSMAMGSTRARSVPVVEWKGAPSTNLGRNSKPLHIKQRSTLVGKHAYKKPYSRRSYRFFTEDEEDALIEGVEKYRGRSKIWHLIQTDSELGKRFKNRTNIQLKDKYRTIKRDVGNE